MNHVLKRTIKKPFLATVLTAALIAGYTSTARASDEMSFSEIRVSQPGDVEMNCSSLSREASTMRDIITQTHAIQKDSERQNMGVTVAKAVGSALIGTAAGGVGIMAAGFLLSEATGSKAEDAETIENLAEQRHSFMMGIFNAKECEGVFQPLPEEMDAFALANIAPAAGEETYSYKDQKRYND